MQGEEHYEEDEKEACGTRVHPFFNKQNIPWI